MPPDSIRIHGKTHALNFTYDQLEKKVNGERNIGELKFGSDGKLHRVNNHVTLTSWNKTVLTGEENYEARMVIWKLIDSRWSNDRSDVRLLMLNEARELLLGNDVAYAPVSRDEVRLILSMLKSGTASAQAMSDIVMIARQIKKTGGENVAALLQKGGFPADQVSRFVKGWDLSPVARNRSDNFTHWADRANALEMDMLLCESKAANASEGTRIKAFKRDFSRMLVDALREEGVETGQSVGNEPVEYETVLNDALKKISRMRSGDAVSRVRAKLRERMLQHVEELLLGGNGRSPSQYTSALQIELRKMQTDVASVVKRLWDSFPAVKGLQQLDVMHNVLNACGVEKANIRRDIIDVTVVHPDGRTEQRKVDDTDANRKKFAPGAEPDGAGQGRVGSVRRMARASTSPVLLFENAQETERDLFHDECFELPGLGEPGDLYTLAPKADSLQQQYVERIKGKLAGAFDDIFNGTDSLFKGCKKLLDERADLFTLPAIDKLADKEFLAIRDRDIRTLTGALSQYAKTYGAREETNMQMSMQELLDTYRIVEGPVEDLSVEDFGRRVEMRNKIDHLADVLSRGSSGKFDGLGFGFPSGLEKMLGLSTFYLATHSLNRKEDDISSYVKIIKLSCRLVFKDHGKEGQKAVDAIALKLLERYGKSNTDLDTELVKRQANRNGEGGGGGFDVLGKLGQVVDYIVKSKEERNERKEMHRVQNVQRLVVNEQNRDTRCQRVRGVIARVLDMMGYEMKIENKLEGNVYKLVQGQRILELPQDQAVQGGAVA